MISAIQVRRLASCATQGLSCRLTLAFSAMVIVFVGAVLAINVHSKRAEILDRMALNADHLVALASEVSLPHLLADDPTQLEVFFEQIEMREDVLFALVVDANGWVMAGGEARGISFLSQIDDPLLLDALEARERRSTQDQAALTIAAPITVGDQQIGAVMIAFCRKDFGPSVQTVWTNNLSLGFLFLAIGIIASRILARKLTHPLKDLTWAAQQVAHGDLDHKIPTQSSNEFQHLAVAFNSMVDNVRTAMVDIHRVAYEDKLTGVPNRSWINTQLEQLTLRYGRSGVSFAVMFLDLDKFKGVNDAYGHHIGDQLLRAFAKRLTRCLREEGLTVRGVEFDDKRSLRVDEGEALLGRLGGDEFTVIVPRADAENVARRIDAAMESVFRLEGRKLLVATSIGIALYPQHARSREHLLKCADVAMYEAKRNHTHGFAYYDHRAHAALSERSALERDLDTAIRNETFDMALQPQRRVGDDAIVAAEALIRWNHPVRGQVPPSDFLPVAASNGQLPQIGRIMLAKAIEAAALANKNRTDRLTIAVNVGVEELNQEGFAQMVLEMLERYGAEPTWLEIEITEGTAMEESIIVETQVAELSEAGVRFAIDDFGVGYSNLGRLRALAFQTLKIDRSLIIGLGEDPASENLVTTILDMAHAIGADVVAEGIETQDQLAFLQGAGCGFYQGYFGGKPMPAADFIAWAQASTAMNMHAEDAAETHQTLNRLARAS